MLRVTIETGEYYEVNNNNVRNDYIRIVWSTGYIYMRMYNFNKLKKKYRDLLLTDK